MAVLALLAALVTALAAARQGLPPLPVLRTAAAGYAVAAVTGTVVLRAPAAAVVRRSLGYLVGVLAFCAAVLAALLLARRPLRAT